MEDGAKCPAGTFAFSDMHAFLVPRLKEGRKAGDVSVAIVREGTFSTTCQYINELETKPFFVKAQQSCTPVWDKDRFAMLLKKFPFASEFSTSKPMTEAPLASTPWNIIIALFLAAIGLLWWILKRRS